MNEQIQQLQQRLDVLENFILSLQADSTIPLEVDRAFVSRLQVAQGAPSTKSTASGTVTIGPGGGSAMKTPDGFIVLTINGTPRNIPYIN